MKIMFLNSLDLAGLAYNLCNAVNKYTNHEADHIVTKIDPILKYPRMHYFGPHNASELRQLVYDSDALIFNEWPGIWKAMDLDIEKLRNKIIGVTFGGAGFRKLMYRNKNVEHYNKISGDVKYMLHSVDFLKQAPDWPWICPCFGIEELRKQYDYAKSEPPVVATSPCPVSDGVNPAMGKVSDGFKGVVKRLKDKGLKFKSNCISSYAGGVPNAECLRLKAPASIFFDRLYMIYGMNSIEAAGFESAVVTETSRFARKKIHQLSGVKCPFVIVNTWEEVEEAFAALISDSKYRRNKGLECYKYAEAVHGGKFSANRLIKALEG